MQILDCTQVVVTKAGVFFYNGGEVVSAESDDDIAKAIESITKLENQKLLRNVKSDEHGTLFVPSTLFCEICDHIMILYPTCKRCLGCGNVVQFKGAK